MKFSASLTVFVVNALLGVALVPAAFADPVMVHVEVNGQIAVNREHVLMEDVADLRCRPACEELKKTVLAVRPRAGYASHLTRMEIESVIRGRFGTASITWHGAESIEIRGMFRRIEADEPEAVLSRLIREYLVAAGADILELKAVNLPLFIDLPPGRHEFRGRIVDDVVSSEMTAWLDAYVDGRPYRTLPVRFRAKGTMEAWVAARNLNPGDRVDKAAITRQVVPIPARKAKLLKAYPGDVPMRAILRIQRGELVAAGALEPAPPVERGSTVEIRSEEGSVAVITVGEALGDAHIGEDVKVRTSSGATVVALVVGDAHVMATGRQ